VIQGGTPADYRPRAPLSLREFLHLCSAFNVLGSEGTSTWGAVAAPVLPRKFDIVKVLRDEGALKVFVDCGQGNCQWYEL
jgi:hypothetical protein